MSPPLIESYEFGKMVVDGQSYQKDLILLPDRVLPGWWRSQGHRLQTEDLQAVFDAKPEVLVVGTGAHGVMAVPNETRQAAQAAGIELRAAPSTEAWQLYNRLRNERRTAGAFHLTC